MEKLRQLIHATQQRESKPNESKLSFRAFQGVIIYLNDIRFTPNDEINKLAKLFRDLYRSDYFSIHTANPQDYPLPALTVKPDSEPEEWGGMLYCIPTNFTDIANREPILALGNTIYWMSILKDLYTGTFFREKRLGLNAHSVNRAEAAKAEFGLTLLKHSVAENQLPPLSEDMLEVLTMFPQGIQSLHPPYSSNECTP